MFFPLVSKPKMVNHVLFDVISMISTADHCVHTGID